MFRNLIPKINDFNIQCIGISTPIPIPIPNILTQFHAKAIEFILYFYLYFLTKHIRLREIIVTPDPTPSLQGHSQHPTVTTQWVPTILPDGATTYIEIIFTQTFASVLDPLPSPGEGEIGMPRGSGVEGPDGQVEIKAMGGADKAGAGAVGGKVVVTVVAVMAVVAVGGFAWC